MHIFTILYYFLQSTERDEGGGRGRDEKKSLILDANRSELLSVTILLILLLMNDSNLILKHNKNVLFNKKKITKISMFADNNHSIKLEKKSYEEVQQHLIVNRENLR